MRCLAVRWAILALVILALWQALYTGVGEVVLRSPAQTLRCAVTLIVSGELWPHLAETSRAFAMALVIAVVSGLLLGLVLGMVRLAHAVFEPMLVASYSVPKITLYPLLLLSFGLGISAKVAFGVIHGLIPIALFTTSAIRQIRPVLLKAGRAGGLSGFELARRVLLPAAMPEILAGLRVGFSLTLIGTLLGEMFASQRGLGFLLMNAIGLHDVDTIMALTFLLTLFALAASTALLALNRHLQHGP